ncbi:MAG: prepilin-type N-terminal cleavage/methylation domain-containing protein [Candidatus Gracilibacteria bacterium]
MNIKKQNKGFSLIEIILAAGLFALLATGIFGALIYGEESPSTFGRRVQAVFLADEGLEAVRNIRDSAYVNLTDGAHGLAVSGGQWAFSGTQDINDIFTRQVQIAAVGTKRKMVTSTVTWNQNEQRAGSTSLVTYLTNWMAAGHGNWALPQQVSSLNLLTNANGLKIKYANNYAYIIRNGNGNNFYVIDLTNLAAPTVVGSINLTGVPVNIDISGNYAYITTNGNSEELQIVNISNPVAPALVGIFNAPGNADGSGVFVNGTTVYSLRVSSANDEFIVINASNPAAPTSLGSLDLGADANEIVVLGSYAYIASADNSQEIQVVNISNPASMSIVGSLNITGNTNATTIDGFSNIVALGRGSNVYIVDVTNPLVPATLGSIAVSDGLNDLVFDANSDYVFLAKDNGTQEFQVLDISTPAAPVSVGTFNLGGAVDGIAYDSVRDRAYSVGVANAAELVILAPQ